MVVSSEAVDVFLSSSRTEALEGQSLDAPSSNPSLSGKIVYSESRDNSPSKFGGFSSISTVAACSDKTLDGSLPGSCTEVRGDNCFYPQLSVIPVIPAGEALVTVVLNDRSLVDTPIESQNLESVVSSNGRESSPCSPVDPNTREIQIDEDDKSAMQIESEENPSSPPASWELLAEEHYKGKFDDNEQNLAKGEPIPEFSNDTFYRSCNCNRYHGLYRPAYQWGRWCGPHCESNRSFYDSCRASGGRWGLDREDKPLSLLLPVPTGVGAGLSNLGNTCFINAILQCFTHTVPLVKALRSSNHLVPCQRDIEGFCVVCALRDHIELSLASSGKIISPSQVVDNLNHISSCFYRYQQEDAHEFLQCLLDKLERCCLDSNANMDPFSSQDDNIVERVFGGRLVSKLRCCNCGHCSDKYEPLIDLSLEVEDVDTLQSALGSFTKVEKIEDDDTRFRCDNCKEEACREKQLMLDQVPSVAALHLKRFKTDGSFIEKIGKHVQFPLELDFKPYSNSSQDNDDPQVHLKYQLYAIVVHNGFLPTSGHYFSYIRSSPGTWHKLDDSMVIKAEEEMVLSEAAYILFYVREDAPWFSSLMETQKDCLYPRISNASPKSVLDNVDTECAAYPHLENIDVRKARPNGCDAEGNSTLISCVPVAQEAQINQIGNDAEKFSAQYPYGSGQNGAKSHCDESKDDAGMNDASVLSEVENTNFCKGILHNEKIGSLAYAEENNGGQVLHIMGRNDVLDRIALPESSSPDNDFGGLPEAGHYNLRDHLKVESSVTNKKMKKGIRDQKMEALRCIKTRVRGARGLTLRATIVAQNDKKRKLRWSPCKQSNPPGCRSKFPGRRAVLR